MTAFTIRLGAGTATGVLAGQFVERGLEFARVEFSARLDLFTAFPPICILVIEYILGRRVGLAVVWQLLIVICGY